MKQPVSEPFPIISEIQFLRSREIDTLKLLYKHNKKQITFSHLASSIRCEFPNLQKPEQCMSYAKDVLSNLNIIKTFKERNGIGIPGDHTVIIPNNQKIKIIIDTLEDIDYYGSKSKYSERNFIQEIQLLSKLNNVFSLEEACKVFNIDRYLCLKKLARNELIERENYLSSSKYYINAKGYKILNSWIYVTEIINLDKEVDFSSNALFNNKIEYISNSKLGNSIINNRLVA